MHLNDLPYCCLLVTVYWVFILVLMLLLLLIRCLGKMLCKQLISNAVTKAHYQAMFIPRNIKKNTITANAITRTASCFVISTQLLLDIFFPPSLSVILSPPVSYTNLLISDNLLGQIYPSQGEFYSCEISRLIISECSV